MDISKLSIIEVKSFNEMVDLQAELHTPILYYEKGKCSLFMVINEGNLYRFVLNKESWY